MTQDFRAVNPGKTSRSGSPSRWQTKGGRAVKPQHRSFAQNRALAAAAGRKGGQTSQSRRIGGQGDNSSHGEDDSRPSGGTDGDTNNG